MDSPERNRDESEETLWNARDFRHLSRQILLFAGENRGSYKFFLDVSRLLILHCACDALELWVREREACVRWELTAHPERFYRLKDTPTAALDALTSDGTFSVNDLQVDSGVPDGPWRGGVSDSESGHGYRSLARFPLQVGEESCGLLVFKDREPNRISPPEIELFRNIAPMLAVSMIHQQVQHAQTERVKELTCLYRIAQVAAQGDFGLESILEKITEYIPPGWQYPEITVARIILDGKVYQSGGLAHVRHHQQSDIVIEGDPRGMVEVCYVDERPDLDEGPFLREERSLIDAVAREVANIVQRRRAESERLRLQAQLRHADRLATIGQLAAGVAHELNEPLGGILGFTQLAQKHSDLDPQLSRDLSKIESASLHAREIVRKLMLFARQTPPEHERIDVNHVVMEALSLLESRSEKAGVDVVCSLLPQLPKTIADPNQIRQVVVNLVVNALQAMPEGGTVRVETRRDEQDVLLLVSDTGRGMPEDVRSKIFEPFFTTKDVGEGTGLGLAVVHGIVTSHRGRIHVESEADGGTRFEVRLPIGGPDHDNHERH